MDGSWSGFAEDLCIKESVRGHTTDEAGELLDSMGTSINRRLEEYTYKHNRRQLEIAPSMRKRGASKALARARQNEMGKVLPHARHLGGRLSYNDSISEELLNRGQQGRVWMVL